jgi:hypothetical protein
MNIQSRKITTRARNKQPHYFYRNWNYTTAETGLTVFICYLDIIIIITVIIMLIYVSILIMAVMMITGRWLQNIYEIVVNCV